VRHGKTPQGKQRYCCRETSCKGRTFLLDYSHPGQSQHIKDQIVDMARTRIKRLVRRTICFSKTERMHDLVIGLFVNRYEFERGI
jgi:transposase-like protein